MSKPESKITKDWKTVLTPEVYHITREGGTEAPFSGEYYMEDRDGSYHCSNCGTELFGSGGKYHSGCGWPSFYESIDSTRIRELRDTSHGMVRTEIRCAACDAHLGHIFPDGPKPTGMRYCVNSLSLKFSPMNEGST